REQLFERREHPVALEHDVDGSGNVLADQFEQIVDCVWNVVQVIVDAADRSSADLHVGASCNVDRSNASGWNCQESRFGGEAQVRPIRVQVVKVEEGVGRRGVEQL